MVKWSREARVHQVPEEIRAAKQEWAGERRATIAGALNTGSVTDVNITMDELLRVVKHGKFTALGEDGVTYDILNALAAIEDGPSLHLFNRSYNESKLPRAWKKALIIPLPKARGGFRPVSLVSCFSK